MISKIDMDDKKQEIENRTLGAEFRVIRIDTLICL